MAARRSLATLGPRDTREMKIDEEAHRQRILTQFTHQAKPFADAPAHSAEDSLKLILSAVAVSPDDEVLDVACGPGIVSCALAAVARQVTGVDLVPAMIEQARKRQAKMQLANVHWRVGDAAHLEEPDNSFSLVVTRYSFHHLVEPVAVLREMVRVCRPGGCVAVIDVTPEAEKMQAYDEIEIFRDPSHVHALCFEELAALGQQCGLILRNTVGFGLESTMEALLAGSFPPPGNADRVRAMVRGDIGKDRLSIRAFEREGEIFYVFPTTIMVWTKPLLDSLGKAS